MAELLRTGSSGLSNSVIVVTGGASGIGRAFAVKAAPLGATVMIGEVTDSSETVLAIEHRGSGLIGNTATLA